MLENEGTLYIECQTSLPNNNCPKCQGPELNYYMDSDLSGLKCPIG